MANEGTSFNEGWKLVSMGCVCVFQVILAYESIVLCKCSGNVLLDRLKAGKRMNIVYHDASLQQNSGLYVLALICQNSNSISCCGVCGSAYQD